MHGTERVKIMRKVWNIEVRENFLIQLILTYFGQFSFLQPLKTSFSGDIEMEHWAKMD